MNWIYAVGRSLGALHRIEVLVADSPADRILGEGLAGIPERNLGGIDCMGPT